MQSWMVHLSALQRLMNLPANLFRPFASHQTPPPTALTITAADFQSYWTHAHECTSTFFSGLHFGHYKAAAACPILSELHAIFTQLCFANGFSPQYWQSGLQVVLEKKTGAIHIDLLCALLLMEADFNFGNKLLIGHWMVSQATHAISAIPQECFGSVKGHCAIHVSLSGCLVTNIAHQCQTPLALACADAAQCYDNIGHAPGSIACQCLGASPECMATMFHTLCLMRFFLHMAYGDSSTFYGGGLDYLPFQGVCQENGAGPAVWLALSSCLVHMIHTFGYFSTFPVE